LRLISQPRAAAIKTAIALDIAQPGATLLKTLDMIEVGMTVEAVPLAVGTLVAFASGIFAIRAVQVLVQRQSLQYFAYYCFAIGIAGLILI